jgi:hypothetical protein
MVSIGISEFTFGFAFLHEQTITQWDGLTAAPILPSLQQEANAGWDAHIPLEGEAFFYQFKLSDYLFRSNATFISNGTYTGPYYRVELHKREFNRQHRLLRAHCLANPNTFYAAPELQTILEFNTHFLDHTLTDHSRLLALTDCDDIPDTDPDQHVITFQPGSVAWNFHSEQKRKEHSYFGVELGKLYRNRQKDARKVDLKYAIDLLERSRVAAVRLAHDEYEVADATARRLLDAPTAGLGRTEVLQRAADLVTVVYGLTMVIVGPSDDGLGNPEGEG